MNKKEGELLTKIGILIGSDWSGMVFDGRDVQRWIDRVVSGDYEGLDRKLIYIEESY